MTDDVFLSPDEPEAAPVAAESARPFKAGFLPDGTRLLLTASRVNDMAMLFHDDFSTYLPQRADEWAILLWMATRDPAEWRDARGEDSPLMLDFPTLRSTVGKWLDEAFRLSEANQIRLLAIDLWMSQNAARVVPSSVQKKTTEADHPSTPPPSSLNTSTLSPEAIPEPAAMP